MTAITVVVDGAAAPRGRHAGVDLASAPHINVAGVRRRLARHLGKALSMALISRVEADITRAYRASGYPLVSVSTPEQELTGGALLVRVVEFRLGRKTAPGSRDAAYLLARVQARPGERVSTLELAQDLDWLNRYPFRRVDAAFTPGARVGQTDLVLQATPSTPFSVYGGYANSGSPLTGFDRYFAGVTLPLPFLRDATFSYQFTGSNDVFFNDERLFHSAADPQYLSHSARLFVPTLARQAIEATYSYVASNEETDFVARQTTQEYAIDYRSALSNLMRGLPGEAAVGVEAREERGSTLFAGEPIQDGAIDVFQVFVSLGGTETDRFGHTAIDATVHLSPGGINRLNTDVQFADASQGRSTRARYGYASGTLSRYTGLPGGFAYSLQLIGQYSSRALPLTEQIGVGGPSLVRGYTLDDGVGDSVLIMRNELRTPTLAPLGRLAKVTALADAFAPFLFVDAAYAKNAFTHGEESPIGVGLGADYQLGTHLAANLTSAWALKPEGFTHKGQFRLESRIGLSF